MLDAAPRTPDARMTSRDLLPGGHELSREPAGLEHVAEKCRVCLARRERDELQRQLTEADNGADITSYERLLKESMAREAALRAERDAANANRDGLKQCLDETAAAGREAEARCARLLTAYEEQQQQAVIAGERAFRLETALLEILNGEGAAAAQRLLDEARATLTGQETRDEL